MSDLPVGELGVVVEPYGQKTETDVDRLIRRAKNMAKCGKRTTKQNKLNGKNYHPIMACGYAGCERCHGLKVEEYQARPYKAMLEGKSIRVIELSEADATEFVRMTIQENFLRLPGKEHDLIFFDATICPEVGKEITNADIDTYDWSTLLRRVPGRKISGQLGKKEDKKVYADDVVEMLVPDYSTFASQPDTTSEDPYAIVTPSLPELYTVDQLVYKETPDLCPTDELTLCTALTIRAERTAAELRKRGYQVQLSMKMIRIKVSLIELDWLDVEKFAEETVQYDESDFKHHIEIDPDDEDIAHLT
jgi:hypothetical protein